MPLTTVDQGLLSTNAQYTSFKNRLINGQMMIDQRNNGASVTPVDASYTPDRWQWFLSQASKLSAQRSTTAPAGFINSLAVTSLSSYSVGSSDLFSVLQQIEGLNVGDLGWGTANAQTVTVSFQVRSSLTGTFGGWIRNWDGSRGYVFSYTISSANTWETKSVTIAGDTSGTWLTTNGSGLMLGFSLGAGSTRSTTAGSWGSTAYYGVTGGQSVVGTSGATFYITGIQLEKGQTATSFDVRPYGTELALCQRYYAKLQNDGTGGDVTLGIGTQTLTTNGAFYINFPVTMRSEPTATITNIVVSDYFAFANAATLSSANMGYNSGTLVCTYSSAGAQFRPVYLAIANNTSGNIALSSEL
jgi:hypothetical protein